MSDKSSGILLLQLHDTVESMHESSSPHSQFGLFPKVWLFPSLSDHHPYDTPLNCKGAKLHEKTIFWEHEECRSMSDLICCIDAWYSIDISVAARLVSTSRFPGISTILRFSFLVSKKSRSRVSKFRTKWAFFGLKMMKVYNFQKNTKETFCVLKPKRLSPYLENQEIAFWLKN